MKTLRNHLSLSPQTDLYHYTTISGFLGIVGSQKFWATDIYYMNDTKELSYAGGLVNEVLLDRLKDHKDSAELTKIFKGGIYNAQYVNVFCISFSEARDLLSQWRGYGGESGMALCFTPEKLETVARCNDMSLAKCIYDRDHQVTIISELCEAHAAEISAAMQTDAFDAAASARRFFDDLCSIGPILKHPSFKDENEWRMLSGVYDMVYTGTPPRGTGWASAPVAAR